MALNPFFADATAIASVSAITGLCNTGKLEIYNGAQPADANTAVTTQAVLATLTLGVTAFGAPVASGAAPNRIVTATANAIASVTAGASGTAAWFRQYASNGTTVIFDGSVGTAGCDLNLNTTAIVSGANVSVTSYVITQPE